MIGVSDLRARQKEILEQLANGPVVLTQRSQALAVLVDVAQWNALLEELADLRDAEIAHQRLDAARSDPSLLQPLDEVENEFRAKGLLDD